MTVGQDEPVATSIEGPGIEQRVRAALVSTGVAYELLDCDPQLADTAAFCAAYGHSPDISANTILVTGKGDPPRHVACIALATTKLDVNGIIRRRLGVRKASFASAADTAHLTGMLIGGVTPFGLPADLHIWVDSAVLERPAIVLGGGSRSLKVLTSPAALLALANAAVVEGLAVAV